MSENLAIDIELRQTRLKVDGKILFKPETLTYTNSLTLHNSSYPKHKTLYSLFLLIAVLTIIIVFFMFKTNYIPEELNFMSLPTEIKTKHLTDAIDIHHSQSTHSIYLYYETINILDTFSHHEFPE